METKFKIMDTKVEVLPVMGQDQDSFGGGFQADQSYSGKLADLRVMDRVLEHSELNRMNPCDLGAGWALLDTWVTTNVDTAVEISDYFCSHHYHKNYFISTQYVDFNQSKEVCDLIQGTLPLPETEKDLQDMSDLFMDILSNLHASFLLGYIFQPGDKKWYNVYTDKPVSDTNFINEHIREDIHCFMKWPAEKDFYPISCKQRQAAIFCKVKEEFRLYLKGLCSDEQKMEELLFDDWFYIQGVKNGRSHFRYRKTLN